MHKKIRRNILKKIYFNIEKEEICLISALKIQKKVIKLAMDLKSNDENI